MESEVWQRLLGGGGGVFPAWCRGGLGAVQVLQGCHTDEVNLAEHLGGRRRSPPPDRSHPRR